jgi:hypothetical protein
MPELNNNKHVGTSVVLDGDDLVLTTTLGSLGAASSAQGSLADSAVQPSDLAAVAISGEYGDLANPPTLGTAAAQNASAFATSAQGAKADSALQSGAELTSLASTGAASGYVPKANGSGGIAWGAESGGGGGDGVWGSITGTLSDQTDLNSALGAKVDDISGAGQRAVTFTAGVQDSGGVTLDAAATASTIAVRGTSGVLQVGTPSTSTHATTKDYVDTALGTKAAATRQVTMGNVSGTATVNVSSAVNTEATMTLTGATTLAFSNVPSGRSTQVLFVTQDGTGGRSLSYPANTTFLNGGNGSINHTAGTTSILVVTHLSGSGSRVIAISDTRALSYDSVDVNPQGDGDVYKTFAYPTTLNLSGGGYTKAGTGTVAFAKSTGGSFTSISSAASSFAEGDVLRVTTSGFSGWLTLAIPRGG